MMKGLLIVSLATSTALACIAMAAVIRTQQAIDQADRALALVKAHEEKVQTWQSLATTNADNLMRAADEIKVCRSMLTPQQRQGL